MLPTTANGGAVAVVCAYTELGEACFLLENRKSDDFRVKSYRALQMRGCKANPPDMRGRRQAVWERRSTGGTALESRIHKLSLSVIEPGAGPIMNGLYSVAV